MATKLFVGGLPFAMQNADLSDLFSQVGTVVSATIITDKFTGRSKGFGFVEFATDEEAEMAIQKLNGTDVGGRQIVVNAARPQEPRENRSGGGRGGFGGGRRDGGNRGNFRGGNRY